MTVSLQRWLQNQARAICHKREESGGLSTKGGRQSGQPSEDATRVQRLATGGDMLVLTRKPSEKIRIGNDVIISIIRIQGDKVRIGIDAPSSCSVHREEVYRLIQSRMEEADRADAPKANAIRAESAQPSQADAELNKMDTLSV